MPISLGLFSLVESEIFATKIGNRMVDFAQVDREETEAVLQTDLVAAYYALRLAQRVVKVREETYNGLQKHYQNALKLEANGMINKAERLFSQVSMDEAKRELESARKDLTVAQNAFESSFECGRCYCYQSCFSTFYE